MTGASRMVGLAAAVAALAVAGCGDDARVKENNAYVNATKRVMDPFDARFQSLGADITPVSKPEQDLKTLRALRVAVDDAVAGLAEIEPPGELAGLHRKLVSEVRGYGPVIQDAERGLTATTADDVASARKRFSTRLTAVVRGVAATIQQINAKLR